MEHLDTFLAGHPPFKGLPQARVIVAAAVQDQPIGTLLLVEDGPPATAAWVVLSGSMDIVHQGEVIQVLEPGELFGHPSLLSGMSPAFTVRAREPSRCAVLPAEAARQLLATDAGVAYVARTMRKRLTRAGHTVHGLQDVGTTPVSAIMRPPVFAAEDETVRSAARRLGEDGVAALLVALDDGALGIITDADIRAGVAAGSVAPDGPARALARSPAPTVPMRQLLQRFHDRGDRRHARGRGRAPRRHRPRPGLRGAIGR